MKRPVHNSVEVFLVVELQTSRFQLRYSILNMFYFIHMYFDIYLNLNSNKSFWFIFQNNWEILKNGVNKPKTQISLFLRHTQLSLIILSQVSVKSSSRPVYYSILELFDQRSQYISIKFPLPKLSENLKMCY